LDLHKRAGRPQSDRIGCEQGHPHRACQEPMDSLHSVLFELARWIVVQAGDTAPTGFLAARRHGGRDMQR
jgi:hypothetical protein